MLLRRVGLTALTVLAPVALAVALAVYRLDPFEPAPLPLEEIFSHEVVMAPRVNGRLLLDSELLASGQLLGAEDFAFDSDSQVIYTGCADGWIKKVSVNHSTADIVVHNLVNTGGRPLGIALGLNRELIVADSDKGLLHVTTDSEVKLLTDEAEGRKFKFLDGVDIAKDGTVYFTDASWKYSFHDFIWDILEGRPHGKLLSFNPITGETRVLARHLYFPNGVVVSPDQKYIVFCETIMRRCRKYITQGENAGSIDPFVDNLPGLPDNIRYDGANQLYWIGLPTSVKPYWDIAQSYPMVRKVLGIFTRHIGRPRLEKNSGVLALDLEGMPVAHYYDPGLELITTAITVGEHLYLGSLGYPHILRVNMSRHPAL